MMRAIRLLENHYRFLKQYIRGRKQQASQAKVSKILASDEKPSYYDNEEIFNVLQASYSEELEYGYDYYSSWQRGTTRALQLLKIERIQTPGCKVVEIGCGDGMTSFAMASFDHQVFMVDLGDWRHEKVSRFPFLLTDASQGLPFSSNEFDLVFSYNTLEHVGDPELAFHEMLRVCKVGGSLYLEFGPLYASPWGLHAYRTLRMPYPQFIFSEGYLTEKFRHLGIVDLGETRTELQPLNKWRLSQYRKLWNDDPNCNVVYENFWAQQLYLDMILRFPKAFTGYGLDISDVTVQSIFVNIIKDAI